MRHPLFAALFTAAIAPTTFAETYSVTVNPPGKTTPASDFHLGTPTSPAGPAITVDGRSLLSDGKPVIPVMGEFHYARVPREMWRTELLKMKAGGITIVSTYVFWIHHEEIEGKWDWSGNRDLHAFLETCKEIHFPVLVRMGPWCHGEVRNGGFPDWLVDKKLKFRSTDPAFMAEVKTLYQQIAEQMKGMLYKEGGPLVGIQVDNEYHGSPAYLLALKKLAQDCGIDVPLYTRTGWPNLTSPMAFGELLPYYSAYAEGAWDRVLTSMPAAYWQAFTMMPIRTDVSVGTDMLGKREHTDESDAQSYPYFTCELGAGMEPTYQRRIVTNPMDAYAIELCKLASGCNLPGFYMYHGGLNPEPETPSFELQEHLATHYTNLNDMPVRHYDYNAPLGTYGEVRESYHLLRELHTFLHDFGPSFAGMTTTFADNTPQKQTDLDTLRWSVRSDGKSGYVFINNYQRGVEMPEKKDVQFDIKLPSSEVKFPEKPLTFPANTGAFFPFNFDLGNGKTLLHATAQPLAQIVSGNDTVTVFEKIPGISADFAFNVADHVEVAAGEQAEQDANATRIADVPASHQPLATIKGQGGNDMVIVLSAEDAKKLYHLNIGGTDYLILSEHPAYTDGKTLSIQRSTIASLSFSIYPTPPAYATQPNGLVGGGNPQPDGLFTKLSFTYTPPIAPPVSIDQTQKAGTPRTITIGSRKVAVGPTDADFAGAEPAVYAITLPADLDPKHNLLLKLNYLGDVARLYAGDKLLLDNFYSGTTFNLAINTLSPDDLKKPLTLKILPLQKDAPIYIQKEYQPDFTNSEPLAAVKSAELVETVTANFSFDK